MGRPHPNLPTRALLAACGLLIGVVLGLSGLKLIDVPGGTTAIVILICAGAVALLSYLGIRAWARVYRRTREGPPAPPDG